LLSAGEAFVGPYFVYNFTTANTTTIQFPYNVTAEVLIVAGGGGSGRGVVAVEGAGGGGGGGVGVGTLFFRANSIYTITVGAGGPPANLDTPVLATKGGFSRIAGPGVSETAYGGGFGGSGIQDRGQAGGPGGSGGGGCAAWANPGFGTAIKGSGTLTYYGNDGAPGRHNFAGGGGGGATGVGGAGSDTVGGDGGAGYTWDFTGETYGGGGGGGGGFAPPQNGGQGGSGGGGAGGSSSQAAVSGAANTGGGGGGAYGEEPVGAAGGSGVIIIAFIPPTDSPTTGNIVYGILWDNTDMHCYKSGLGKTQYCL